MEQEQRRILAGASIGHAAHDAWYGLAPVMLAAVSAQLGFTNSDIGLALLLYQGVSSLTQPLFGRLAEKYGGRALGVGAILWTTLMFSFTLFAPTKELIMLAIALAGLGSGSWHPQATTNATLAGGAKWGATAAAIFFLGGTMGSSLLGAALGGALLDLWGRPSLLILSAITVVLALTVVRRGIPRQLSKNPEDEKPEIADGIRPGNLFSMVFFLIMLGIALRSLTNMTLSNYIPKQLQDMGISTTVYGLVSSLFLAAVSVGGVVGSYLADRLGLRNVLAASMVLAAVGLLGFTRLDGLASYLMLGLTGFFIGPSHTLFIVAGQRQFPGRMATVTGIFLGFTFVSGSGGAWLLGLLADHVGFPIVMTFLPLALVGAAIAAVLAIPQTKRTSA